MEHINLLVENNTDNLLSVLEPWKGYISTRTHDPELHGWQDCFKKYKDNYTWIAFMDIDEYLNPLKADCLSQVLEDYEQYGGLSVSYGLFSDPKHRIARRYRETPMEATNFTLGQPHPLVKALCVANHTKAPSWHMPHCCSFKEGHYSVDENFEHVGVVGKPCWFQVSRDAWVVVLPGPVPLAKPDTELVGKQGVAMHNSLATCLSCTRKLTQMCLPPPSP